MDRFHFDALTRSLTTAGSRRLALATLLGGAFGRLGLAGIEAKRKSGKCKPKCTACEKCDKGTCDKKNGKKVCKKGTCKPKAAGSPCTTFRGGVCQNETCFATSSCPAITTPLCAPGRPAIACGGTAQVPCVCTSSTEGQMVCVQLPPGLNCPDVTPCSSSATCGAGFACVEVGSCCTEGPANGCLPACPNPYA
jgi:hypothetical protein